MRILQVCHRFPPHPGGIEYHVQRLSKFLSSKGHDVMVLTTSHERSGTYEEDDYTVIRLKANFELLRNPIAFSLLLTSGKIVKDFDVIHMHSVYTFTTLMTYPFTNKNRVVITLHGRAFYRGLASLLAELHERLSFRIVRDAAAFIALSGADMKLMLKRGIDPERVRIIPNFVDVEEIDNILRRSELVDKEGEVQLVFVGGLVEAKNLESLLVDLRCVEADASLWVIGDGPLREKLTRLARGMKVRFLGRLSRESWIPYALSSDAIVLPSKSEGFPTVVLEAMALEKPVILSNIEVHRELFSGNAILYEPGVQGSLSSALDKLRSEDLRETLRKNRKLVEERYDIKVVGRRILDLYNEISLSS
ncbi:MAG: glycosyltransferase family 4 protein [Candidatus Korarchaeum sp.]|nr:glycosyltransferase family 4 protein [Candidatus Korarchaeum sp.]MDW8035097.1 glycosyltransferase family 4 protein [Candidatus Korarchaeum sp.]